MSEDLKAYSVMQAAELLGLSEVQLRRIIARGDIRVKRAGRRVLVPPLAIREYLGS